MILWVNHSAWKRIVKPKIPLLNLQLSSDLSPFTPDACLAWQTAFPNSSSTLQQNSTEIFVQKPAHSHLKSKWQSTDFDRDIRPGKLKFFKTLKLIRLGIRLRIRSLCYHYKLYWIQRNSDFFASVQLFATGEDIKYSIKIEIVGRHS